MRGTAHDSFDIKFKFKPASRVLLEPDVAEALPDAEAVNQALRALVKITRTQTKIADTTGKLPNTGFPPSL